MRELIDGVDAGHRAIVVLVAVGLVIVVGAVMARLAKVPRQQGSGPGALEFAALTMATGNLLRGWDREARRRVKLWHWVDCGWAAAYATVLAVAAASIALAFGQGSEYSWMGDVGEVAAWLAVGAFAADVLENLLSIALVAHFDKTGKVQWLYSTLTAVVAGAKFLLAFFVAGYVLVAAALAVPG